MHLYSHQIVETNMSIFGFAENRDARNLCEMIPHAVLNMTFVVESGGRRTSACCDYNMRI